MLTNTSELPYSPTSRRTFLSQSGSGIGLSALSWLLHMDGRLGAEGAAKSLESPVAAKSPHHPAKANAVIEIFCPGGMSHVDTFDYKPILEKSHGKSFDSELAKQTFAGVGGTFAKSFWKFNKHGQCGKAISDLFPRLATMVDEIAFLPSMRNKSALHGPAMFMMNTGYVMPGFPTMGAWVTYGLGSESANLPAFVVLPDVRGLPPGGVLNWGSGFLPAIHQGTVFDPTPGRPPIQNLFPSKPMDKSKEAMAADFLNDLNIAHRETRKADTILEARMASYELAARLQLSAPEAVDLSRESKFTKELYLLSDEDAGTFGIQCLLSRRLVERGVRFVQIFCGSENTSSKKIRPNWDSHEDIVRDHGYWGRILDSGCTALLMDLKARGLLETTLVICTTEFGRQPFLQGGNRGRDHNPGAFTSWMAGGGIRGGATYGSTDEVGLIAAESPCYSYDLHATALHLLGLDHEKLSYYHNGIPRRLTDVHGKVLSEILA